MRPKTQPHRTIQPGSDGGSRRGVGCEPTWPPGRRFWTTPRAIPTESGPHSLAGGTTPTWPPFASPRSWTGCLPTNEETASHYGRRQRPPSNVPDEPGESLIVVMTRTVLWPAARPPRPRGTGRAVVYFEPSRDGAASHEKTMVVSHRSRLRPAISPAPVELGRDPIDQ